MERELCLTSFKFPFSEVKMSNARKFEITMIKKYLPLKASRLRALRFIFSQIFNLECMMSKTFISSFYKRQLDWHSSNFFLNKMSWTKAEEIQAVFCSETTGCKLRKLFVSFACLRDAHEGTRNFLDAEIFRTRWTRWAISLIELTNGFLRSEFFIERLLKLSPFYSHPNSHPINSFDGKKKENFSANRSCSWMTFTTPENYGLIYFFFSFKTCEFDYESKQIYSLVVHLKLLIQLFGKMRWRRNKKIKKRRKT